MSLIKQLAGQTVIYGLSNILPRILHFVVFTIYLTYRFPKQFDFAVYLELYAYATIILIFMTYRMETAFFRFGADQEAREKAFSTALIPLIGIVVFIVALMVLFSNQLANLIDYPHKPYYIKWFAFILGFDALVALPYARMRLDNKAKKFLFYRLANIFITILVVLFCLEILPKFNDRISFINYDASNRIDYVFIANLIASTCIFILMFREFFKLKFRFDVGLWKKMIWYSLPLVVVGIAGSINQSFAPVLQKKFLAGDYLNNMTNAGIYGAAAKLALLLNLFTVAFNYAAEPFFFNNAKNKDSKLVYGKVALAFTLVATSVLLFISTYMAQIGNILGPNYRAALPIVPILLYAYLFLGLYYNFSIWYKLNDKTYWGAIISICAALITLVVSIYTLPRLGYIGSAWAALACYSFMALTGWLTGQKYYPINYPMLKILRYIFLALLFSLALYLIDQSNWSSSLILGGKTLLLLAFIAMAWFRDGKKLIIS